MMEEHSITQQIQAKEKLAFDDQRSVSSLESLAGVTLDVGRMLMEAGASAGSVQRIVDKVALGLGAERVELRIGYGSLAVTVGIGAADITRMRRAGELGVNQRLIQGLWDLGKRVTRRELTIAQTRVELTRLASEMPQHSP